MTCDEFLSAMKSRGAIITAPVSTQQTQITNTVLQQMRCAMIPAFMADLYNTVIQLIWAMAIFLDRPKHNVATNFQFPQSYLLTKTCPHWAAQLAKPYLDAMIYFGLHLTRLGYAICWII
jgi:hypothetical protein